MIKFRMLDGTEHSFSDALVNITPISLGHTVQIEGTVYEVIGVRHDLDNMGATRVDLDTVGKKTMPPPPEPPLPTRPPRPGGS